MIRLVPLAFADPQGGLNLEDTQGVNYNRFTLQWDTGSPWNPLNVDSEIFSTLAGMFWVWYRDMVAVQIWVLDWVLGMDWLGYILAPLAGLSIIVQGMIAQIGLLNVMLIILAFVVGFWLLKGRYAGGFMELLIGCVIAALATGFLANPMATIGGEQGVIMQSRNAGMDIATGFATEGASFERDSTVIRDGLKGQLVDTLLRAPHQIINYGSVIDGTGCEDTYTENVGREDAVDEIGGCDSAYGEAASTVDAGTVVSTLSLLTTGFVFLLLSVVIVGGTIFAVLLLGWSAIKLLWQLPVGVISSGTRAQLFRTFASVGFGCILVAMATMFLVAWMKMLLGFYDATSGLPFLVRLYLFNTLVVAGAVFYVLMGASVRQGLRALADKLAAAGVPSQIGEPAAMPWDGTAKWRDRYNKAKSWAGVGLGPAPVQPNGNAVEVDGGAAQIDSSGASMDDASESAARATDSSPRTDDDPTPSPAGEVIDENGNAVRTQPIAQNSDPQNGAVLGKVDGNFVNNGIRAPYQPAPGWDTDGQNVWRVGPDGKPVTTGVGAKVGENPWAAATLNSVPDSAGAAATAAGTAATAAPKASEKLAGRLAGAGVQVAGTAAAGAATGGAGAVAGASRMVAGALRAKQALDAGRSAVGAVRARTARNHEARRRISEAQRSAPQPSAIAQGPDALRALKNRQRRGY
ncbi:hypothetical protein ACIGB8_12000 [Promicromonospora sukumoe]|uniref:hypothetical protein n=1 Tax=Promicromonospora sukumoe TaxID=88382 RepID=UPI0037CAAE11